MCSTLVIVVFPSANRPAATIAAPALKSVATTDDPFNFVGPTIVAVWFLTVISAPNSFKYGTCINLFSQIVSVVLLFPLHCVCNTVNGCCKSVAKPG